MVTLLVMARDTRAVAEAVKLRLAALNWPQAQLAREAGTDPNTISDFLNGVRWPRRDTRERIESALGWPAGRIEELGNIGADGMIVTTSINQTGESPSASGGAPTALFNWLSQTERMGYSENQRAYIEAQAFAAALKAAAELDEASRKQGT